MKTALIWLFTALWVSFGAWLFYDSITALRDVCLGAADPDFCQFSQRYHSLFLAGYIISFIGSIVAIFSHYRWRNLLIALFALAMFNSAEFFVVESTKNAITYSYEWFYVVAALWLNILTILFFIGLFHPIRARHHILVGGLLTFAFIILASLTGRAGAPHVAVLIGSTLSGITLEAVLQSQLVTVVLSLLACAVITSLIIIATRWVRHNNITFSPLKRRLRLSLHYAILIAFGTLSLPLGWHLHGRDVAAAVAYIEQLERETIEHFKQHGEYPPSVTQLASYTHEKPRLLKRHDYVIDAEAAYYFSREDHYCFVFHDAGPSFGYYSKTTNRGWQLSHFGEAISDHYTDICDANDDSTDLVAGHLGMFGADDPVAKSQFELGGDATRPALTATASQELQQRLNDLREKNPEIFEDTLLDPATHAPTGGTFTPDDARDFTTRTPTKPLTAAEKEALKKETKAREERVRKLLDEMQPLLNR